MATALKLEPAACDHHAYNSWEVIGGGIDPNILEYGKCCGCGEWLARETDLVRKTVTHRQLESGIVARLVRDELDEWEGFV